MRRRHMGVLDRLALSCLTIWFSGSPPTGIPVMYLLQLARPEGQRIPNNPGAISSNVEINYSETHQSQ